jgi:hypothetical protein
MRLPEDVRDSGVNTSLALGAAVVRGMLGKEWADKHLYPNRRDRGFVTIDESSPEATDLSAYKVIDLAELLFNLQKVPDFDECVDRMRRVMLKVLTPNLTSVVCSSETAFNSNTLCRQGRSGVAMILMLLFQDYRCWLVEMQNAKLSRLSFRASQSQTRWTRS